LFQYFFNNGTFCAFWRRRCVLGGRNELQNKIMSERARKATQGNSRMDRETNKKKKKNKMKFGRLRIGGRSCLYDRRMRIPKSTS
jgi:hypothetical protein